MVMMPPPPIPCRLRPAKKTVKFLARGAQRAVPAVKKTTEEKSISLRPKMSDSAAMKGWKTAQANRYEVPAQNASMVEPSSSSARFYISNQKRRVVSDSQSVSQASLSVTYRQHGHENRGIESDHDRDQSN